MPVKSLAGLFIKVKLMSVFTIILIIILVGCYAVQNFFSKLYSASYKGAESAATPVFSVFYGLIIGLATFCYNGFSLHPDLFTLIIGILNGGALFLFNLSYINSSKTGPYSFQSMMVAFGNILVPLACTLTLWGEKIKLITIIGIVCMLAAFVLFNAKGLHFEDAKKGYWLWIVLVFLANGLYSEFIDAQSRHENGALHQEMIIITFLASAVISFIHLLISQKGKLAPAFSMGGKAVLHMILSSCGACVAINLLMIVLETVSSTILFPVSGGSLLIVNALLSVIFLHEKLDAFRIAGIIVAAASLVIVNL